MTLKDITQVKDLNDKRVFVTCDFNISLNKGSVTNDIRIREVIPTIDYLLKHNCRLILASHLDRPDGRDPAYSLKPVAGILSSFLKPEIELDDFFLQKKYIF